MIIWILAITLSLLLLWIVCICCYWLVDAPSSICSTWLTWVEAMEGQSTLLWRTLPGHLHRNMSQFCGHSALDKRLIVQPSHVAYWLTASRFPCSKTVHDLAVLTRRQFCVLKTRAYLFLKCWEIKFKIVF